MKKRIWVFGLISGFIIICTSLLSIELGVATAWLGFLVMFLVFTSIFVAIKQVRDEALGGVIRFSTAFLVGLGITVVASLVYVLVWEFYLAQTDYAFIELYTQAIIDGARSRGVPAAELANTVAEMETMRQQYANPVLRLPMTFIEIFPVGLLVSVVSAFILRDRTT